MADKKTSTSEGVLYVSIMLLFFPMFLWTDYTNITMVKMIVYLASLGMFVLTLFFSSLWEVMVKRKNQLPLSESSAKLTWDYAPDLFLLLFLVSGSISCLLSPYKTAVNRDGVNLVLFGAGRYDGIVFLAAYALVYFLVSRYATLRPFHLKAFAFVLLWMCGITVVQLSGINPFDLYPPASYPGWYNHFVSTIGNVDIMGGFLCTAVPLVGVGYVVYRLKPFFSAVFLLSHTVAIYAMLSIGVDVALVGLLALIAVMTPLLIQSHRYVCKLLDIGMSIAVGFGLAMMIDYPYIADEKRTETTFSFGTAAILAVVLLVVLAVLRVILTKYKFPRLQWKWVRLGVIGLEVLAVIGAFCYFRFVYQPTETSGLMLDLYELTRGKMSLTAGHNRIGIWKYALQKAKEHPWFGTGTGTFATTFRQIASEVGYTRYSDRHLDFAHNEYVHYLCTLGISGITCYLGFLGTMAWRALRQIKNNPRILVLGAAVLGYSVQVFFSFSIIIVAPLYWLLMGLLMKETRETVAAAKAALLAESKPEEPAAEEPSPQEEVAQPEEEIAQPEESVEEPAGEQLPILEQPTEE